MASDIRNSTDSVIVRSASKTAPVNNDDVVVSVSQESVSDVIVDGRVAVVVPSVDDDFECSSSVVVGVADGVHVAVDDELAGGGIASARIFKRIIYYFKRNTLTKNILAKALCIKKLLLSSFDYSQRTPQSFEKSLVCSPVLANHVCHTKCNSSSRERKKYTRILSWKLLEPVSSSREYTSCLTW